MQLLRLLTLCVYLGKAGNFFTNSRWASCEQTAINSNFFLKFDYYDLSS